MAPAANGSTTSTFLLLLSGDSAAGLHPTTAAAAADAVGPSQAEESIPEIIRAPFQSPSASRSAISIPEVPVPYIEAVSSSSPTADVGTLPEGSRAHHCLNSSGQSFSSNAQYAAAAA